MNNSEVKKEAIATTPNPPEPRTVPIIVGTQRTLLPTYDPCPKWLIHCGLSPTARIVYLAIYARAISRSLLNHEHYTNDQGHIFVIYTNDDLAKDCALTLSSVKSAKKTLKSSEYIMIEKIQGSNAVRIYPRFPFNAPLYPHLPSAKKGQDNSNSSIDWDEFAQAAYLHSLGREGYENFSRIGQFET